MDLSASFTPSVPFFLYDDPVLLFGFMGSCMELQENAIHERRRWMMPQLDLRYNSSIGTVHEFAASKYFVRMMMTHPWRTRDPSLAEIFIIPADVEPVYLEASGPCSAQHYQQHLWASLDAVFEKPYVRVRQGADHFWMMSSNDPERMIEKHAPALAEHLRSLNHLHFMSVGVIELFPLRSLMALPVVGERDSFVLNGTRRKRAWRCSMPVPFVHSFPFSNQGSAFVSFQVWMRRKFLFYHQFSGFYQDDYSRLLRVQALKIPSVARSSDSVWVGDRFVESEELARGFRSSRFCFAIAGRRGGPTRKFYDAVANACIPVVVSDQWPFSFAPFPHHVRHEDYAVFIPEERWLKDLTGVIRQLEGMPLRELAARYRALREVAPLLVYDRPDSHALGAVLLWELQKNCGAGAPRDEQRYPVDVPLSRPKPNKPVNGTAVAAHLLSQSGPHALVWRKDPKLAMRYVG